MIQNVALSLEDQINAAMRELLPAMQVDGGGAEEVSMKDGRLVLRLIGTCTCCPSRELSAKSLAEGLSRRVPTLREVRILCESDSGAADNQSETLIQIAPLSGSVNGS